MSKTIIGIDPGLSGAICVLNDGDVKIYPMPVIGKALNEPAIRILLYDIALMSGGNVSVGIEEQYFMLKQTGVKATLTNYGILRGICAGLRLSYIYFTAREWKPIILKGLQWKAPKGEKNKEKYKMVSCQYVSRKYPHVNLLRTPRCAKPSHDWADSVCIAEHTLLRGGEEAL